MSLNRNSPIDYLKHSKENTGRQGCSLSIVTGCKHHESDICNIPCYARRMVEEGRLKGNKAYPYGFEPTFHPERIKRIGGKPKLIFLNDMGQQAVRLQVLRRGAVMKVLIACEFSGIVRDAFRKRGHDAWSCDLDTCDADPTYHIQGDVLEILDDGWDLMIAHPPCTHLAVSGARYFKEKRKDGRQQEAIKFFMAFIESPVPRVAVENPVGIMSRVFRKPDQYIQPWEFGHCESKRTGLWLKNLPLLNSTKIVEPDYWRDKDGNIYKDKGEYRYSKTHWDPCKARPKLTARYRNQTPSGRNKLGPSEVRAKIRSITYQGIADAMAEQWGGI